MKQRTEQIEVKIISASGKAEWSEITAHDLQAIEYMDLSDQDITQLKAHDFTGMSSLKGFFLIITT